MSPDSCLRTEEDQLLAGYSSGCAVAFEMASQLERIGETVSLLAILDAGLVSHPEYFTERAELDWIWQSIQRVEVLKGVCLGLEYEHLAAQPDDQARWELAAEYLYRYNVLPEHSTLSLLINQSKGDESADAQLRDLSTITFHFCSHCFIPRSRS